MAILIPNMDKPENCVECEFLYEAQCFLSGKSIFSAFDDYDMETHRFKDCPIIEVEVDTQTFSFLQALITKEKLTYKELAEAIEAVKEKRKQANKGE